MLLAWFLILGQAEVDPVTLYGSATAFAVMFGVALTFTVKIMRNSNSANKDLSGRIAAIEEQRRLDKADCDHQIAALREEAFRKDRKINYLVAHVYQAQAGPIPEEFWRL